MKKTFKTLLVSLFLLSGLFAGVAPTFAQGQQSILDDAVNWAIVKAGGVCEHHETLFPPDHPIHACCTQPSNSISREKTMCGDAAANSGDQAMLNVMYAQIDNFSNGLPVSGQTYFADVYQRINPVDEAYAQGIGFSALSPVLGIWKAFRNIAYFMFILIFIGVGFAIMFRARLNPQTVINIENALPQLVITLILITLSYAIAGLMIDIMYISIYLLIGIFQANVFTPEMNLTDIALERNIWRNFLDFMFGGNGGGSVALKAAEALGNFPQDVIDPPGSGIIEQGLGVIVSYTTSSIFMLIILGVLLFNAFKVFFALITAYIQIILSVIISPIVLLANAYPGSKAFSNWLRNLAKNLAVFPTIIGMFFLAYALFGVDTQAGIGYTGEAGGFAPPQLNFGGANGFQGILGLGILTGMPKVIELVQGFFGGGQSGGGQGGGGMFGIAGMGGIPGSGGLQRAARIGQSGALGAGYSGLQGMYSEDGRFGKNMSEGGRKRMQSIIQAGFKSFIEK